MKIRHLFLVAIMALTTVATAVAQAPLSFTYQAVVRNSSGRLVSNATVGVKISIVRDSATGQVVYSGVQTPRTNANGLFTLVIGDSQNGIDTITWRNGPYFLKSEVDPNGGTNYTLTSVQQMLSVPYALHAHTVDSIIGGVNFTERQVLSMNGDTVFLTGGSYVVLPPSFSGDYNDLTNKPTIPTNVSAFTNDAGYLTSATLTETQVLSIRHDTVFLTGGSFVKLPAGFSGNYNDLTNKPTIPTVPTNVSAFYNDAGYLTSATLTETQVLSMRHDTVFLTGGSFVKLPAGFSGNYNDLTNKPTIPTVPTNVSAFTNDAGYLTSFTETQVLSIRHDTVFLTGGSFVKLPASFSGNYNDLTNKPVLFSGVYDSLTNKPTNVSSFTNDAGYLTSYTETQVLSMRHDTVFLTGGSFVKLPAGFSGNYNDLTNKPTIPTVPTNVSAFTNDAGYLTNATLTETQVLSIRHDTVFLTGGSFVKLPAGFSGNYNDLTNKPTIPTVPTNVSAFTNDAGYLTSYTETQVLSIRHDTVFLTGGSFVKLPAGFSGDYNDLTNKPTIPTNVSAFNNDAGYLTSATLTETQVLSIRHDTVFLTGGSFVKLPAGFSGNYNDLTNKPTIPTVPTNVSAFTNDAGYLTNATLTETQVLSIRHDTVFLTGGSFVKLPAGFSGNYNDLTNKPTIPTVPTNVSAFTNDAGYLTSATLTETQVLSKRSDTIFLTGGSFVVLPAETQNLSDVATNNDSVNSQIKNLYDPTDSMDAVNLRTLNAVINRYDSIVNHLIRVIDTLRQDTNNNGSSTFVSGLFSVSDSQQVSFSCGNLQYSTTGTHAVAGGGTAPGTWRFAKHQWDIVGVTNSNISSNYSGWIDLFGWGTSGWNNSNYFYQPYDTSNSSTSPYTNSAGYGYGPTDGSTYTYSLTGTYANSDWGVYNAISNGGNMPGMWRTLTKNEWDYLLNNRVTTSGIRYAKAIVNGVKGLIIVPDNWIASICALSSTNTAAAAFTTNELNSANWSILEQYGAVFLPVTCDRNGTSIGNINSNGFYWSSTCYNSSWSYNININNSSVNTTYNCSRYFGKSVRLVKDTIPPVLPTVTTTAVSNITDSSATSGGNVTNDGGATISARGVCWSTSYNPTISDSHTSNGTGTGSFTSSITGLTANTTYYVRAYATNSAGTAYGSEVIITTATIIPEGALLGVFSVAANKQVRFSKGNLIWSATGGGSTATTHAVADGTASGTWRFTEHQWDVTATGTGWVRLFGWATSGYQINTFSSPNATSNNTSNPYSVSNGWGYGPVGLASACNLTGPRSYSDWGVYNAISNGGNQPEMWRILSSEEWAYLIHNRTTSSGIRYAKAKVNGVEGLIIVPDNWNSSTYVLNNTNTADAAYTGNVISSSQWVTLENSGCTFLPCGGRRDGSTVNNTSSGQYWTSSEKYNSGGGHPNANSFLFTTTGVGWGNTSISRFYGCSVRLVKDCE